MKVRGRPIKGDAKRKRASFTLKQEDIAWLRKYAGELDMPMSTVLEQAIYIAHSHLSGGDSVRIGETGIAIASDLLKVFCDRNSIKRLAVYGSALGKNFDAQSDLDLLVQYVDGKKPGLFAHSSAERELSALLGRKVDLRTFEDLSRYFREQVRKQAEVLYG